MGDLSLDTRVEPHPESAREGTSRYRATLSPDWEIWGPNGGYLASVALRAAGRVAKIPRPAAFHAHFLRVARFDVVDIDVTPVQTGRRAESIHVTVRQDDRPVLTGLLRTAVEGPGLVHDTTQRPDVAPPESLETFAELDPDGAPPRFRFWRNLESKPAEGAAPGADSLPAAPQCRMWNRFVPRATFDDPFVDAARSLVLLDTMGWPAAVRLHTQPAYYAPSLDIVAWFHRAAPDEAWLLSDHECPIGDQGLMAMNGRIWTRDGRLLASGGAQLMCVPAPPA